MSESQDDAAPTNAAPGEANGPAGSAEVRDGKLASPAPFGPGVERFLGGDKKPSGKPPRPAATVLVLRDGADGLEVFMVQRSRKLTFMGGAWVFPGGRVDAEDGSPEDAAVREVEEEISVRIDAGALKAWSRWITPVVEPKRFDARFYACTMPEDQQAEAVVGEVTGGRWMRIGTAIQEAEDGEIVLPPPTLWTLMELLGYANVEDALAAADARDSETPFFPRARSGGGGGVLTLVLPQDPTYDDESLNAPESAWRRFALDGNRWRVWFG